MGDDGSSSLSKSGSNAEINEMTPDEDAEEDDDVIVLEADDNDLLDNEMIQYFQTIGQDGT